MNNNQNPGTYSLAVAVVEMQKQKSIANSQTLLPPNNVAKHKESFGGRAPLEKI